MTRKTKIFKYIPFILLFGCFEHPLESVDSKLRLDLKELQTASLLLEQRALAIESQIDELRRAPPNNQTQQRALLIEKVQQFELDFETFESDLTEWKKQLIVSPNVE